MTTEYWSGEGNDDEHLSDWAYECWRWAALAADMTGVPIVKTSADWALNAFEDEEFALSIDWSRHALLDAYGENSFVYKAILKIWEAIRKNTPRLGMTYGSS